MHLLMQFLNAFNMQITYLLDLITSSLYFIAVINGFHNKVFSILQISSFSVTKIQIIF